jgi:hypothetical protein
MDTIILEIRKIMESINPEIDYTKISDEQIKQMTLEVMSNFLIKAKYNEIRR